MLSPLKLLERLSLTAKVWVVVAFVLAGLVTVTVIAALDSRRLQMEARVRGITDQSTTATSLVENYYERYKAGELTETAAKTQAMEALRHLRWNNGSGYVFVL